MIRSLKFILLIKWKNISAHINHFQICSNIMEQIIIIIQIRTENINVIAV